MSDRVLLGQMTATLATGKQNITDQEAQAYVASAVILLAAIDQYQNSGNVGSAGQSHLDALRARSRQT